MYSIFRSTVHDYCVVCKSFQSFVNTETEAISFINTEAITFVNTATEKINFMNKETETISLMILKLN